MITIERWFWHWGGNAGSKAIEAQCISWADVLSVCICTELLKMVVCIYSHVEISTKNYVKIYILDKEMVHTGCCKQYENHKYEQNSPMGIFLKEIILKGKNTMSTGTHYRLGTVWGTGNKTMSKTGLRTHENVTKWENLNIRGRSPIVALIVIWTRWFCVTGTVLCIVGCLEASLASTH